MSTNDFNQSDVDNFFNEEWNSDLTKNSTANQANPTAYVLGGQPGAGKSKLTDNLKTEVFKNNVVIINGDEFRKGHPKFDEYQEKYGKDASKYTGEFAGAIVRKAIEKAVEEKRNIIVEGTFRTADAPMQTLQAFKDSGYRTGVAIATTDKETSWNSTTERYKKMKENGMAARATPKEHHDLVVKQLPYTADEVFQSGLADDFRVYSREKMIYSSYQNNISPKKIIQEQLNIKSESQILIDAEFKKKLFFAVPYTEKEDAKGSGLTYDKEQKVWFCFEDDKPSNIKTKWTEKNNDTINISSISDFIIKAESIGLEMSNCDLTADGIKKRTKVTNKKQKNKSGEYKIYSNSDGSLGGYACNYMTAEIIKWTSKGHVKESSEKEHVKKAELAQSRQINIIKNNYYLNKAKEKAQYLYDSYTFNNEKIKKHPYIINKGIKNIDNIKLNNNSLIIPLKNINGEITSLQFINGKGNKLMLAGIEGVGGKQGSFYAFGNDRYKESKNIILAEGYATAEALYQSTKIPVICCVDSGNLVSVAKKFNNKYPDKNYILAADNDLKTEKNKYTNIGLSKANEATKMFKFSSVSVPEYIDNKSTDWNDVLVKKGSKDIASKIFNKINKKKLILNM